MLIYGRNVAFEKKKKKEKVKKVYLLEGFRERDILFMITSNHIPYKTVDKRTLDRMVDGVHQGIVLEVEDYNYCSLNQITSKDDSLLVMLDHIEDPHNFGAIIRTCEAAGVDGIIIPKDRAAMVNGTVFS